MLQRATRRAAVSVLAAAAIAAGACATKTIESVLADPSKYRNREVQISGDVVDSYGVLGRGVYRVRDDSGELWVMSSEGVPRTGVRVKVRGTVRDAFSVGPLGGGLPGVGGGVLLVESSHDVRR
jgi:hypothetical protein